MDDRPEAGSVDVTVDNTGKLWVNIDGVCVLRIGQVTGFVLYDDPISGNRTVYMGEPNGQTSNT